MSLPSPILIREEIAKIEIGHTDIRRGLSAFLAAVFLFVIFTPATVQIISEQIAFARGQRTSRRPHCLDLFFRLKPIREAVTQATGAWWHQCLAANRAMLREMHAYEDELENQSIFGQTVRRPVQYVMSAWLGVGNEKSYGGRHPWLFYRPDVDHLILPGFLEPARIAARRASGSEWRTAPEPDPIPAIAQFQRDLAERGIELILVPTPVKPMIHPDALGAPPIELPIYNLSWSNFLRAVYHQTGARVFDPAPILAVHRVERGDAFLKTDTHWTPAAMQQVAEKLAAVVREIAPPTSPADARFTARPQTVRGVGDLVTMLQLPAHQTAFPLEMVEIRQILGARGEAWRPDPSSEVLLLGDSFSNIYSLEALSWGASAGFAEQLSYELQRSVDVIIVNDNGAFATRAALARELKRGRDRLAGKRVVIWQFAVRELSEGDWRLMALERGSAPQSRMIAPPTGETWKVRGVVLAIAPVPLPGSVPYKDHVAAVHLGDVARADSGEHLGEALCYMISMRNQQWTRTAGLRPGDEVELILKLWADVAAQYEGINRSELDDENLQYAEPCWAEWPR